MTRELLVFYITFPSKASANKICSELLSTKLIACFNLIDIASAYWWQDAIQQEDEVLALIKTSSHLKEELTTKVDEIHPYEVPCIIHWPIKANEAYRDWVIQSVKD